MAVPPSELPGHSGDRAAQRLLDVLLAVTGLILTAPILAVAALGIRLASPGPVLYRARRVGRGGAPFVMYKLRTMHAVSSRPSSRITARDDRRVFPLGALLRRAKIDELPQLFNVLRGDMAIVGPRPEDPEFVVRHYEGIHLETLNVRPGLASPGSLYQHTHGDALLGGSDPEAAYVTRLLPFKLALDLVYLRRASLRTHVSFMVRTLCTIAASVLGRRRFPDPPEAAAARKLIGATSASGTTETDRVQ